ncbi:hypothetical protein [Oceanisphaera sp. W20_SRM_FM3]|uniref:hypothetical protein n=1 Tax=Oceanisphaera sp. W20_SRM_FM3 TaxID=3240267 RepID=UPI003F9BBD8B
MNLLHENHQLHFFVNNTDIEVNPDLIRAITEFFPDLNLAPTYGKEFNPLSGEQKDILVLISPDQSLRIEFPSHETMIFKEGGTQEDFKKLSIRLIDGLAKLFPFKKGNRLSMLNAKFYEGSEGQYEALYKSLFTYKQASPFEWDNRVVEKRKLPISREEINSISMIRRVEIRTPYLKGGKETDVVIFELDSNTIHQNTSNRFRLQDSIDIYSELQNNNLRISEELKRYFDA